MRSDLVKASAVLGLFLILGAVALVFGMRWAIGSALAAHLRALEQLDATMAASAEEVESAVERGSVRLAGTVEGSSTRVAGAVETSAATLKESVERGYREPLLVRAPEALPVTGAMGIEGVEDGRPLNVAATLGRENQGGEQRPGGERDNRRE